MVSVIYNRCATWLSDVHVLHCRWAFLNVPFLRAFKDIFCFPCSRSRGLHLWKIQDGWCLFRGVSHLPPSLPSFRLGLTAWTNQRVPFSYGFWLRLSNGEPGVGGSEEEKRGGWLGIYAQGSSAEWLRAPLRFLLKATAHLHFTQPVSMFLETCLPWPYSRFHQPKGKAQSFVAFFTPPKPLLIFPLLNTPQITHFDCTLFPVGIPTDKLSFYLVEEGHVWRRKWQIQHELRGGSGNWPSEDRLCLWTLGKSSWPPPRGLGTSIWWWPIWYLTIPVCPFHCIRVRMQLGAKEALKKAGVLSLEHQWIQVSPIWLWCVSKAFQALLLLSHTHHWPHLQEEQMSSSELWYGAGSGFTKLGPHNCLLESGINHPWQGACLGFLPASLQHWFKNSRQLIESSLLQRQVTDLQ